MESDSFRALLLARAQSAELPLPQQVLEKLEHYYRLLARWNARINLTSLPLDIPTEQTVDRLLIEPVLAARFVAENVSVWFDLGSGGGSPAIPLQLVHPAKRLVMVESRERKAAFLSHAIREIPVPNAEVVARRIEQIAADPRNAGIADLVTVRAVRVDAALLSQIQALLRFRGQAVLFGAHLPEDALPRGLQTVQHTLNSRLVLLTRAGV